MDSKVFENGTAPAAHSMTVRLAGGRTYCLSFEHLLSRAMYLQESRAMHAAPKDGLQTFERAS